MSLTDYRVVGTLYILAGLPGLTALVLGKLQRGGNPYFALSVMGVPLGILFLVYGFNRIPRTFWTDNAVRIGIVALLQPMFMVGSWYLIQQGRLGFGTAYEFFGVLTSFLSLLCLVLLIAGAVTRGRNREETAR